MTTALQSRVGAFCSQREFRVPDNHEPVGSILRRMRVEDPVSYKIWWEDHPDETWEHIDADNEEREAAWLKEFNEEIDRRLRLHRQGDAA